MQVLQSAEAAPSKKKKGRGAAAAQKPLRGSFRECKDNAETVGRLMTAYAVGAPADCAWVVQQTACGAPPKDPAVWRVSPRQLVLCAPRDNSRRKQERLWGVCGFAACAVYHLNKLLPLLPMPCTRRWRRA